MSASWKPRYDALHPTATGVLRALILLDMADVATEDLAIALDRRFAETTAAVESLRKDGWLRSDPTTGADVLVEDARSWLADSTTATNGELTVLAGRLAVHYVAQLDPLRHSEDHVASWVNDHRDGILRTLRVAVRGGPPDSATELAEAASRASQHIRDPEWWRALARFGEQAAQLAQSQTRRFAMLDLSALAFAAAGDKPAAQRQWAQALRLADREGDHEGSARVLTVRGDHYRRWGWLDRAMDTYLTLVDEFQKVGNAVATAEALAELGRTMIAAGEAGDAIAYLIRADELLTKEAGESKRADQVRILELLGYAQWHSGQTRLARRSLARALDLADGFDDASNRIRAALVDEPKLPN